MKIFFLFLALLLLCTCKQKEQPPGGQKVSLAQNLSDDSLMTLVQQQTFQYFWDGAEPTSGLARERIHLDGDYPDNDPNVITSGGSGFGVMAILVGIERGFITREQAVKRFEKILGWLEKADRFHGMYPHWWQGETGKTKPFSPFDDGGDIVESAYLFQGLLCVRQYFQNGTKQEKVIANRIDKLWREAEWDWYRGENKENVLIWHWSPNHGWKINNRIKGWNECLITYILAAASPTHRIPAEVYHEGWAKGGAMVGGTEKYGYKLVLNHDAAQEFGGPLFWSHYSFLGLDPRRLKDRYADYWEHNRNHTLINYEYCKENPKGYKGYGPDCWGLTASYSIKFYAAHQPKEDLGVISPTAALSSMPYTPKESMVAMRHFYEQHGEKLWGKYGFFDAFSEQENWYKPWYLAIDQGPIPVMIENHRTGLLWNLFMSCPEVQAGLKKLGFSY